ncbi:probable FBD-associated F-box protein At1g32375 [Raphanus sativus]|uniref:Probable FBD-associated F-box protein At1g32375 n=1 Tax=Raphanus sativus TaxID=3726 RepID=A0A9W3CZ77_RAPSA|nr:probable FBD-associated F-box protein At1g32375 [Raphanus sativus]
MWNLKRMANQLEVRTYELVSVFPLRLTRGLRIFKTSSYLVSYKMDLISELPEALLLRILSLLPAQDVASTMLLSKRWRFLFTSVPRLEYDDNYHSIEYGRFSRFVDRFLFLHEAPAIVIETLHFKLGKNCGAEDIRVCIRAADKCCVRELIFEIDGGLASSESPPIVLPSSLYAGCRMLVTLKLSKVILEDVSSSISFPSLKTLSLLSVEYPGDEFVSRLLSSCHVLEVLHVEQCPSDNVTVFTVRVPSLKSLVLHALDDDDDDDDDDDGFVIDTPSLEWLDIVDHREGFCIIENGMPKIMTARLDVIYSHSGETMRSITSVKRLDLCLLTSENEYPSGSVFSCLVHLKICTCDTEWMSLLMCMLRHSPNLKSLRLEECHLVETSDPRPCWSEPNSVPECLLSSLEAFEWVHYEGTEEEKKLVAFILRSARCLKKVTICSSSTKICCCCCWFLAKKKRFVVGFFCFFFAFLPLFFLKHSFTPSFVFPIKGTFYKMCWVEKL